MIPARLRRCALLVPLLCLAGCLDFELGSSVSWSREGRQVAFLSAGQPWVYTLADGRLERLPVAGRYEALAWSPAERGPGAGWIALSTASVVRLYCGTCGPGGGPSLWDFFLEGVGSPTGLMWHPDGDRLLVHDFSGEKLRTWKVSLDEGVASPAGAGLGFWGPGGHWILWGTAAPIGRREDHMLFERQDEGGRVLTLPRETPSLFVNGLPEFIASAADASERPLCPRREDDRRKRSAVYCFKGDGELEARGELPALGRVFPDVSRRLFALLVEPQELAPRVTVYDEFGRTRAEGTNFIEAVRQETRLDERKDAVRASRLAWSPDGNWIAWVVDGKLALWNWRNDVVRVRSPSR